ncbi:SpoIIE family protein phosphatase [Pararhodospirillum oryzae]|uniref:PPM-type phosphatase domain-containing protein n=1 Tax=Pararhodospirillum oryzae TaxID=478448 RepID=A0A512H796_9PROT|nr:SpoIIE family protein phosphatase [Pararhodospirillum oryzae]GEO81327.1 hypothetical protein ROR02_14580 [Pararhodospirillum oryzae]
MARVSLSPSEPCGDNAGFWETPRGDLVVVADGLGHGHDAAVAANAALAHVEAHATDDLAELFQGMGTALAPTRGAAVAVARVDEAAGTVTYAALGNIRAAIFGWQTRRLDGRAGIVGVSHSPPDTLTLPIRPGEHLVLWTDGLDEGLGLPVLPRAGGGVPVSTLAESLLAEHAKGSDDACVLVARFTMTRTDR